MTDPLARELADRVAAATPTTVPPFDEVRRRARHRRVRSTALLAASAAVIVGVLIGNGPLRTSNPDPAPGQQVVSPPSGQESTPSRPDPTYNRSEYPSGLVVRLPERDVDLPADTSCWNGAQKCRRGLLLPGDAIPDLGAHNAIDFWFARPGWKFSATFRRADEDCPRASTAEAVRTGDQWFRLDPADEAGRYEVDLYGQGPEGAVSTRFIWTTMSDGPIDPPAGAIALFPESRGEGSYALEVTMDDLAFHPARSEVSQSVDVTVTAADGRAKTLTAPIISSSLDCGQRGSRGYFYYQMEWDEDFQELGPRPLDLEVTLQIRGRTYDGHATWRGAKGESAYHPLAFTPQLPAASVD